MKAVSQSTHGSMKILFLGDIVGRLGRQGVSAVLPGLKTTYAPDIIIANAENASHGRGITEKSYLELRDAGIDLFTSGNHILSRKDTFDILNDKNGVLLRPANYPTDVPGVGIKQFSVGIKSLVVLNLMGRVFMRELLDCPFRTLDRLLEQQICKDADAIFVDFHAEATSEKNAFGLYADGSVSAVVGTHTHIQTADNRLLPKGTAYITDVGGCYGENTVLGVEKEPIIKNFLTQIPQSHTFPESGECRINGVLVEIGNDKMAKSIDLIVEKVVI